MTGNRYPLGTFAEIADIPDEAMPRFLDELPHIIKQYAEYTAAVNQINANIGAVGKIIIQPPIWIDDDKSEATIRIRQGEDGQEIFSHTSAMA